MEQIFNFETKTAIFPSAIRKFWRANVRILSHATILYEMLDMSMSLLVYNMLITSHLQFVNFGTVYVS